MRDEGARAYEMRRVRVHSKDGTRVQETKQLCKNKTEVMVGYLHMVVGPAFMRYKYFVYRVSSWGWRGTYIDWRHLHVSGKNEFRRNMNNSPSLTGEEEI
jgi:hypothetical protein